MLTRCKNDDDDNNNNNNNNIKGTAAGSTIKYTILNSGGTT